MTSEHPNAGDGTQGADVIKRIAVALGVPETAFSDGSDALINLSDALEMMQVWNSLKQAADRRKLLAFGRSLAAHQ